MRSSTPTAISSCQFNRVVVGLFLALAFVIMTPQAAQALRPDCRQWFVPASWNGPLFAIATVTLTHDGVPIEESVDEEFLPDGGAFLLQQEWSTLLAPGDYVAELEVSLYPNALQPLTSDEMAAWNPIHVFRRSFTKTFTCGGATCGGAEPPFTSVPDIRAHVGQLWSYPSEATVAANFALYSAPAGATIDAGSGLIQWTPAPHQLGRHVFVIRVDGSAHTCNFQAFVVDVAATENHPPEIISEPITVAHVGEAYNYPVVATDPDPGDIITYDLLDAPSDMTINAIFGLIAWPEPQLGDHEVTVRAHDPHGAADTQTYTVLVQAGNGPPRFVSTPLTTATRLQPYLYDCHALDPDGDALLYSIEIGPVGMRRDLYTW